MARPKKPGLVYFSLDTQFFRDRKIRNLVGKYSCGGVCIYQYLLCEIYMENGYYTIWDEDLEDALNADLHLSENFTRQVLNYLIKKSLFDGKLFNSVKILTAKSIQRRYQAAKSASSNTVEVDADYWLLSDEETLGCIEVVPKNSLSEKNGGFSEKNAHKSEKNTTKKSKVKESKGKESKGNKSTTTSSALREKFDWSKYSDEELTTRYPFSPVDFTIAECDVLNKVLSEDSWDRYMSRIQKYHCKNAFDTIISWAIQDGAINFGNK